MKITGKNLKLVRNTIDLALAELHNLIALCPDVDSYAEDIMELETEQEQLRKFMVKVDRALEKENAK